MIWLPSEQLCPYLDQEPDASPDERPPSISPPSQSSLGNLYQRISTSPSTDEGTAAASPHGSAAAGEEVAVPPPPIDEDSDPELHLDEARTARLSVFERRRLKAEAESLEHQMTHEP